MHCTELPPRVSVLWSGFIRRWIRFQRPVPAAVGEFSCYMLSQAFPRRSHRIGTGFACAAGVGFIIVMLCSCACQHAPSGVNGNPVVEGETIYPKDMDSISRGRIAKIHVGLSFKEVARIIPMYTN